jgi:hypothetical protein
MVGTVNGCHKNTLGRTSTSSGHVTKVKQSNFLIYLCFQPMEKKVELSSRLGPKYIEQSSALMQLSLSAEGVGAKQDVTSL